MGEYLRPAFLRAIFAIFAVQGAGLAPVCAQPLALSRTALAISAGDVIVGPASFYDVPGETASGEQYDPDTFTAAVQIELRGKFGGIGFGKDYRPCYALAEYAGRRAILKFNDVGPLVPGRKFDLSRAAMAHFGGLDMGVLADLKITLLPPDRDYAPGPLPDEWTSGEAELAAAQVAPSQADGGRESTSDADPRVDTQFFRSMNPPKKAASSA